MAFHGDLINKPTIILQWFWRCIVSLSQAFLLFSFNQQILLHLSKTESVAIPDQYWCTLILENCPPKNHSLQVRNQHSCQRLVYAKVHGRNRVWKCWEKLVMKTGGWRLEICQCWRNVPNMCSSTWGMQWLLARDVSMFCMVLDLTSF